MTRSRLLLLRHAKSAWDDPLLDDHDRPLSPRGEKALGPLRRHLGRMDHRPEVVLCSSARRTVQTLEGVREALRRSTSIVVDDALYLADAEELLASVRQLSEGVHTAMVVAHNPGLEDLADLLIGSGDDTLRRQLQAKLPTGALVTLSFRGPWNDLEAGAARLDRVFFPRPPRTDDSRRGDPTLG